MVTEDNREKAKNNDLPINSMQVVLNKKDKEQLVIKLYQEGKSIREIARQAHLSFGSIGKIIRTINSSDDDNCSSTLQVNKSVMDVQKWKEADRSGDRIRYVCI